MRITIANRISTVVGGAEEYLIRLLPELRASGLELSFFFEHMGRGSPIAPPDATSWFGDRPENAGALKSIVEWKPDVIYCNGLNESVTEADLSRIAPSVYSAHAYVGTCISGRKMHAFPSATVCEKRFGRACLVHYLPRRCGGLNPVSMLTRFRAETSRLAAIRRFSAVVVHSEHMLTEYRHHGIEATVVPLPVVAAKALARPLPKAGGERRLVFLGRLMDVKGPEILIDAAARAAASLAELKLTIAGEGEERAALERRAQAVSPAATNLSIRFVGRVDGASRDALLANADALVVPSVWPEPFGMVGLEAAAFGVPTVAFNVGGIHEWLSHGFSGCLAEPPDSDALAKAIVDCVGAPEKLAQLRDGARAVHAEFSRRSTVDALRKIFERITTATIA
ncbi:MAG: glycosyltransferase family 4 protein [Polyangiaceae bacterium]